MSASRKVKPLSSRSGFSRANFRTGIVVVAEIVDADDRFAPRQQGAGDVAADETRGAGDEDGHGGSAYWKHVAEFGVAHAYNVSFRRRNLETAALAAPAAASAKRLFSRAARSRLQARNILSLPCLISNCHGRLPCPSR